MSEKNAEGHRPAQLRFVQAGIEMTRGNYQEAVNQLEDLTRSATDYYPAWERLALIYREWEEKKNDYLRVIRHLTRLAPQEATVFGYLGEACLINNFRGDAKKAFRQALSISPEYIFAGASLFDLHFEDGEIEECRSVVELMKRFVQGESALVREIVFRAKDDDWETAERLWGELCLSEKANRAHFEYVLQKFKAMNLSKQDFVTETLRRASFEPSVNPLVGAYFIERCRQTKSEKECLAYLESLPEKQNVWAEAVMKHLEILQANDKKKLGKFIDENQESLKNNDAVWGSVGFYLNALGEFQKAKQWFSRWQERGRIEAWMLWNYSIVLRNLGENTEANSINRKALEVEPDDTVNMHLTMLGLDELHAENFENARQIYGQINPLPMSDWDRVFYFLLEQGTEIYQRAAKVLPDEAGSLTRNMVRACLTVPSLWKDKMMRDSFEKTVNTALSLCPGFWFKLRLRAQIFFGKPVF